MSNVCGGNLVGAGPENKKKSAGGLMVRYWTLFTIENCRFSHPGWQSRFTLSSTVPPAKPVAGPTGEEAGRRLEEAVAARLVARAAVALTALVHVAAPRQGCSRLYPQDSRPRRISRCSRTSEYTRCPGRYPQYRARCRCRRARCCSSPDGSSFRPSTRRGCRSSRRPYRESRRALRGGRT